MHVVSRLPGGGGSPKCSEAQLYVFLMAGLRDLKAWPSQMENDLRCSRFTVSPSLRDPTHVTAVYFKWSMTDIGIKFSSLCVCVLDVSCVYAVHRVWWLVTGHWRYTHTVAHIAVIHVYYQKYINKSSSPRIGYRLIATTNLLESRIFCLLIISCEAWTS